MKTSHSFNNVACGFQNILISQKLIIFHSCASLLLALFRNLFTWCTLLQTAALPHRVPLNLRQEIHFYFSISSYWYCLFKTCVQSWMSAFVCQEHMYDLTWKFKFDIILHYAYVFPTLHESSCIICYQTKATLTHKIAYHTSVCLVIWTQSSSHNLVQYT